MCGPCVKERERKGDTRQNAQGCAGRGWSSRWVNRASELGGNRALGEEGLFLPKRPREINTDAKLAARVFLKLLLNPVEAGQERNSDESIM